MLPPRGCGRRLRLDARDGAVRLRPISRPPRRAVRAPDPVDPDAAADRCRAGAQSIRPPEPVRGSAIRASRRRLDRHRCRRSMRRPSTARPAPRPSPATSAVALARSPSRARPAARRRSPACRPARPRRPPARRAGSTAATRRALPHPRPARSQPPRRHPATRGGSIDAAPRLQIRRADRQRTGAFAAPRSRVGSGPRSGEPARSRSAIDAGVGLRGLAPASSEARLVVLGVDLARTLAPRGASGDGAGGSRRVRLARARRRGAARRDRRASAAGATAGPCRRAACAVLSWPIPSPGRGPRRRRPRPRRVAGTRGGVALARVARKNSAKPPSASRSRRTMTLSYVSSAFATRSTSGRGKPERVADLAHRRSRPVGHEVADHPGVLGAVALVDVLDDLLAPLGARSRCRRPGRSSGPR